MDYIRLVTNEADVERAGGDELWIAEHRTLRGGKTMAPAVLPRHSTP
jgi:hypothetical protein